MVEGGRIRLFSLLTHTHSRTGGFPHSFHLPLPSLPCVSICVRHLEVFHMSTTTSGDFKRRTPKTPSSRRAVRKYEAKVVENPKKALFLRGTSANDVVHDALTDLMAVTKPYCKKLRKKNAFLPFDSREHLGFLGFKNDCSLFCFGSHTKKRPNNITVGRLFDFQVLDMMEMGILAADRLDMSSVKDKEVGSIGGKPFFVFEGSEFVTEPTCQRMKSLLIDFFRGGNEADISLDGCDRVLFFSLRSTNGEDACVVPSSDCYGGKPPAEKGNTVLCMRHYAVEKPSSASGVTKSITNIKLLDIGPHFDLQLRRISFAPRAEFKLACKVPREVLRTMQSTQENVSVDGTNSLTGQIHVGKQNVSELNLRRFKAHRRTVSEREAMEKDDTVLPTEADEPQRKRRRKRGMVEEESGNPESDI